jgi:hypothetical protein
MHHIPFSLQGEGEPELFLVPHSFARRLGVALSLSKGVRFLRDST